MGVVKIIYPCNLRGFYYFTTLMPLIFLGFEMDLDYAKITAQSKNREDEKMEHDFNSHNVVYKPMPYGGHGDGYNNNRFLETLLALGLIDRQGNRTSQNATQEQVQHLATSTGLSDVAIKSKLDAMQISICEQTSTLKDSIYNSSTTNAMGQNALGEKVTGIGYRVESNAKDIEKTILVDGGLTRKNDDDNSGKNLTAQTIGFNNIEKSLCHLESNLTAQNSAHDSKMSAEHCEIKGLIKDVKYDLTREIEAKGNTIIAQATHNHNESLTKMERIQTENLLLNKNDQLMEKDRQIDALKTATQLAQYNDLKEEIEEAKRERKRLADNETLSHNINIGNKTAIGDNNFNNRLNRIEGALDSISNFLSNNRIFAGNSLSIGGKNNETGIGN
jgi:hypothetical protein